MTANLPTYDYMTGSQRVDNILNQPMDKDEERNIPADHGLTYSNGYMCRISAIFVDMRDSTKLFSSHNNEMVSRMVRSFTSEIIEILDTDKAAEVGIRGDCVYGIYSTPKNSDVYPVYSRAILINTLIKMLNKQYKKKGYPEIMIGIGLAVSDDLVIKAGKKGSGVSSKVWIGDAVTTASNLSAYGSKNGISSIVMSPGFYDNIIKIGVDDNPEFSNWFKSIRRDNEVFYHGSVIRTEFEKWIKTL